tara:strand:- start:1425 stop:1595 length:171 start_codon:yes stop_codon:yes gene_type:complete
MNAICVHSRSTGIQVGNRAAPIGSGAHIVAETHGDSIEYKENQRVGTVPAQWHIAK